MNPEKINLIIKNMELLIQSLKLEIKEEEKEESKYTIKLEELLSVGQKEDLVDTYEPDYYEER
jgi:hypothetical protein